MIRSEEIELFNSLVEQLDADETLKAKVVLNCLRYVGLRLPCLAALATMRSAALGDKPKNIEKAKIELRLNGSFMTPEIKESFESYIRNKLSAGMLIRLLSGVFKEIGVHPVMAKALHTVESIVKESKKE